MTQLLDGAPPNYSQPDFDGVYPIPCNPLWVKKSIRSPYSGSDVISLYVQYRSGISNDVVEVSKQINDGGSAALSSALWLGFMVFVLAGSGWYFSNVLLFISSVIVWLLIIKTILDYLRRTPHAVRGLRLPSLPLPTSAT